MYQWRRHIGEFISGITIVSNETNEHRHPEKLVLIMEQSALRMVAQCHGEGVVGSSHSRKREQYIKTMPFAQSSDSWYAFPYILGHKALKLFRKLLDDEQSHKIWKTHFYQSVHQTLRARTKIMSKCEFDVVFSPYWNAIHVLTSPSVSILSSLSLMCTITSHQQRHIETQQWLLL